MFETIFGFLLIFLVENRAFNIDTNYPIVYEDAHRYLSLKTTKSTYFGYSVVLYPGTSTQRPWVLIGAPRGNPPRSNYDTPGAVFKCGIAEKCTHLSLDTFPGEYTEKLDGAWIGAAMDINYKTERVVTCGHRWMKVTKKYSGEVSDYLMEGACYWFHVNDTKAEKLVPLMDPYHSVSGTGRGTVYNFGQGQAGLSVHMPTKEQGILLGAPGVYNWKGTAILLKDGEDTSPVASRLLLLRRRRYATSYEFSRVNIASAELTTPTFAFNLFGYSSTSGYFFSKYTLSYASGAPKSNDYTGQVLIYKFRDVTDQSLIVHQTLFGKQFGEYFGSSVTAGDVNGDQLDDLIVGAPFYSDKKYNEGKVYIFMWQNKNVLQTSKSDAIIGQATNGQFGTTVQYLGDINFDGFGDVAVSAPYEEDQSGVVYLFRGTIKGLDTVPCQRIVGRDIHSSIRGFGMSISRGADIDFNNFKDVAIGAYLSGHVVVLRSRPVVTVFQKLKSLSQQLDFQQFSFELSACFSYDLRQKFHQNVIIERTIQVDEQLGRANLHSGTPVKEIKLLPDQLVCENFTVHLQPSFTNRYDPITVTLSHVLKAEPENRSTVYVGRAVTGMDGFCPRCYVYNRLDSVAYSNVKIPFTLGCGTDNICKSSIRFTARFSSGDTFVLGSAEYIMLEIDIENAGEKAYLTQVMVSVPQSVYFRSTPSACSEFNSSVLCAVDNPLDTNSRKPVVLDIDMTGVNSGKNDDSLVFIIRVLTSSENVGQNETRLELKLKREADVTISGKSEEQSYSYRNSTEKPNATQIYQVQTFGSSYLNELAVEIDVPYAFQNGNVTFVRLFRPMGRSGDDEIMCDDSKFEYLKDDKEVENDYSLIDEGFYNKSELKRVVRQADVPSHVFRSELGNFINRTFYINCSTPDVMCMKVMCPVGSIKQGQIVKITLKMLFDVAAVQDYLGQKDVVLLTTQGRVTVKSPMNFVQSGDKLDSAQVETLFVFVGESKMEEVALWIIIVSAVAGFLLLLLIILGLVKAGFFKRKTKEELQQLKKEMQNNEVSDLTLQEGDAIQ